MDYLNKGDNMIGLTAITADITRDIVRALIRSSEDPDAVFVGVHNAFVHGSILEEIGLEVDNEHLDAFYSGIDDAMQALNKITKR